MSDRFSGIVEEYDLWRRVDSNFDVVQERVVDLIKDDIASNLMGDYNTLEIGCGTGHTTRLLLGADKRVRVAAIDKSPEMVKKARLSIEISEEDYYLARLVFCACDICDLDKAAKLTGFFQFVVSVMTFHNIDPERRSEAISVAYRVLRPGGLFVSGDQLPPDDKDEGDRLYRIWTDALEKAKIEQPEHEGAFDFWLKHTIEDGERRLTEGAQIDLLKEAGFVDVCLRERFGIYRIVTARKPS